MTHSVRRVGDAGFEHDCREGWCATCEGPCTGPIDHNRYLCAPCAEARLRRAFRRGLTADLPLPATGSDEERAAVLDVEKSYYPPDSSSGHSTTFHDPAYEEALEVWIDYYYETECYDRSGPCYDSPRAPGEKIPMWWRAGECARYAHTRGDIVRAALRRLPAEVVKQAKRAALQMSFEQLEEHIARRRMP